MHYSHFVYWQGVPTVDKDELLLMVGENLLIYRRELGLTQEVVAEKANISTNYYASVEKGEKAVSIHIFMRLSDALAVSPDNLLSRPDKHSRLSNIVRLLQNQPEELLRYIEKLVRLSIEELT